MNRLSGHVAVLPDAVYQTFDDLVDDPFEEFQQEDDGYLDSIHGDGWVLIYNYKSEGGLPAAQLCSMCYRLVRHNPVWAHVVTHQIRCRRCFHE